MTINLETGMTTDEQLCMNALCKAWRIFNNLPEQHPSDGSEFVSSLHRLQDLLAVRIVRRTYPEGWTTVKKDTSKGTSGIPHF